ncbi:lysophospholipid acyltransferase family protein [Pontibaca salina]|uniref:Lysophospholipid acyltransferase family protein n=1 Tax=Pontibaca salina TaxID=2795731 RepID=A0A934HT31_9RHOB|nr:lysophospholipid acyltransferase family protein [Pontibaca salina]MBI6629109.1 lysophospholipid acyltransferase family protein [Pontibaca salina]
MSKDPASLPFLVRARYFTGNLFVRGLIGLAQLVPYQWRVPMMGWLTARLAPLAGFDVRVRDNLALTCPYMPETEVRRLVRAVPDNVGRTMIELYSGTAFLDRAAASPISGPGLAGLQEARTNGRPAILISGHFGNYIAARASLMARGFEMGGLYRRMKNPYFNRHYVRALEETGRPMFEQGRRGMMEMVRHLKHGGTIAIIGDQHVYGGHELQFFGQPAMTSVVPAELALKYDAALIPIYAIRQPDGLSFRIEAQAAIPHSDPVTMTQTINDGLEALVRDHMDQWFWIHRRWKAVGGQALQPETNDR